MTDSQLALAAVTRTTRDTSSTNVVTCAAQQRQEFDLLIQNAPKYNSEKILVM